MPYGKACIFPLDFLLTGMPYGQADLLVKFAN
jgi:hypothetical protein